MKRLLTGLLAALALPAAWAQTHGPVEVSAAVRHDTLPSLRATHPQSDGYKRWHERAEHALPIPPFPADQADAAVQAAAGLRSARTPTLQSSVDGVGQGFSGPQGAFTVEFAPPDTVGAVGATQYVQVVNSGLAVFDKATKNVVYGPVPTNTLWSNFGGECEADNDGDAVVVYDKAAGRWIVSQFAVGSTPYLQCVAVSQTSDATGTWYRYSFSYESVFPDYPKMGVWPDAWYETFNMFTGNSFNGSKLCAYDRASMLAGDAATQQCFQLTSSFGGVLPADLDGPTPPPPGAPNYLINFGTNSLNLWKFHVDWANPANTTLSAPVSIAVATFSPACNGGACVPQPGVHQQLDSLADRMMFRLAYRNFGDHETLVASHSVRVGTSQKNPYTGVRWYELRNLATAPLVYQQSTFSPDTDYRWMPSIAMDGVGDIALGYSVSSSATFPAVRYTGRAAGDTLGTMQAETSIIEGTGSQSGQNLDRWGDYSAMTVDPSDDCTFWYTTEYLATTDAFNWHTRIGSLKFPACGQSKQAQTIVFTSSAPWGATYHGTPYVVTATSTSSLPVTLAIDPASTGVCALGGSFSGSQVTFIGVGTCTISATQAGTAGYNAAPLVQQSFGVGPATQSVSFTSTAPSAAVYAGTNYTVTATATSALAVALSIDPVAAAVCQIDGSGSGSHVSFIGVGTCTIDASQGGNTNYKQATTAQQSFAVGKAAQSISFLSTAPQNAKAGGATYQVQASSTAGLAVTLTVDPGTTAICQLDGSASGANVSFTAAGTCTIDAGQAGDANPNAAPLAQQSFAVGAGPASALQFTTQPANVPAGNLLAPIAVTEKDAFGDVVDDNGSTVTFTVAGCGGDVAIGSAPMVHGVATLADTLRFYTVTDPATLQVGATTGALSTASAAFAVQANVGLAFADGFDGCRL